MVALPAAPPASAPKPEAPIFTVFKTYENYTLSIDKNSVKLYTDSQPYPLVGLDIKMTFPRPLKYSDAPFLIGSYMNTVAIDCIKDHVIVAVSRMYNEKGELLMIISPAGVIENQHVADTPATELINLLCPPIVERYKSEPPSAPVTKPGALTA